MKEKVYKRGKTKKGEPVMMTKLDNGNFKVYVARKNYVKGKTQSAYRLIVPKNMSNRDRQLYDTNGMSEAEVFKMFKSKSTGGISEEAYNAQKHEWGTDVGDDWSRSVTPGQEPKKKKVKNFKEWFDAD